MKAERKGVSETSRRDAVWAARHRLGVLARGHGIQVWDCPQAASSG